VMPPGTSPVANSARSEPNSLSTSFKRIYRNATIGQTRSMILSAGLHTDQPTLYSTLLTDSVRNGHIWLLVGVRERRYIATTALYPQCTGTDTVPQLYRCQCQVRGPWRFQLLSLLLGHLEDIHTIDTFRYTIVDGIQNRCNE
jgi:hypothetical protein